MQSQTISLERKPISSSSSSSTTRTCRLAGKWEYKCIFCWKTFKSGRALGGHQNAHRFEPRHSKRTHHLRLPKQQENYYYYDHHSLLNIPSSPKNLMTFPSPQPDLPSSPNCYNHYDQIIPTPLLIHGKFPQGMESGTTTAAASSRIESDLIIRTSVAAKGAKDEAEEALDLELRL